MVAAYLALALAVGFIRRGSARAITAVPVGLVCFGLAYLALESNPDIQVSRVLVALATGLAIGFALLQTMIARHPARSTAAASAGLLAFLLLGPQLGGADRPTDEPPRLIATSNHVVKAIHLNGVVPPPQVDGGAIAAFEDGFLVLTGGGRFYRVSPDTPGDSMRVAEMPLPSPLNREAYLATQPDPSTAPRLRATDLLVDTAPARSRLLVAHQQWNIDQACYTIRVSSLSLEALRGGAGSWTTLFETSPCIPMGPPLDDIRTGGRLALLGDGDILLSVGDMGYDGLGSPDLPQDPDADYGKVIAVGSDGTSRVFSTGHRNPQGLMVDRTGRIWLTEHGPEGGDEINLVEEGANYGWPLVSYGTDYELDYWPPAMGRRDHGPFREPRYAFVPSIGISEVIEVGPGPFPEWEGDLLVSSLRAASLYRVRLENGRVLFAEPIRVNRRVRGLAQGASGDIVIWADTGDLIVLTAADPVADGEFLYGLCAGCHDDPSGAGSLGPDLTGILNRPVASRTGYPYSSALQRLGGRWTEERLSAFLRNPQSFAPGTRMEFGGLSDAEQRSVLIEYLRGLR